MTRSRLSTRIRRDGPVLTLALAMALASGALIGGGSLSASLRTAEAVLAPLQADQAAPEPFYAARPAALALPGWSALR